MSRTLSLPGAPLTVDDVHAMFDELEERERAADLAALAAIAESAKLQAAAHRFGPRLLRELRIDSPELRWKAARAQIKRYRDAARANADAAVFLVVACGLAHRNAELRGAPGWVNRRDVLEARAQVKRFYGDAAAAVVSQSRLFSSLREASAR